MEGRHGVGGYTEGRYGTIIIIMVIFKCYFSREHIALSRWICGR